jgi:Holliday junction resolvasome RuvABC endonuclease subunit
MMRNILQLRQPVTADAADALAAAVCHALRGRVRMALARAAGRK